MTKKSKIIAGVVGGVLVVGGIGYAVNDKDKKPETSMVVSNTITNNTTVSSAESTVIDYIDSNVSTTISSTNNTSAAPKPLANVLQFEKSSAVNEDKTGNWRYNATTDSNFKIEEHIAEYYDNYYSADDEIHFIINFSNNTVARINHSGDQFYIDYFEHVENEEHHADIMCTGQQLKQYIVDKTSGKIDDLQQDVISEPVSFPTSMVESVYSTSTEPTSMPAPAAPDHQIGEVCIALSGNGKKYHSNSSCSGMEGNVRWMSVSEAQALGYSACKRCH